ncbi:MAG: hypothetical protein HQM12_13150 [SAR324 cluster bacterium]|nr:hypothetical protein [SAR324 cluster bacterium]
MRYSNVFRGRGKPAGVTLMEMVIGIGIMSIIGATLAPVAMEQLDKAKLVAARSDVNAIVQAIRNFNEDNSPLFPTRTNAGVNTGIQVLQSEGGIAPGDSTNSWNVGAANIENFTRHLTFNRNNAGAALYAVPPMTGEQGWAGPYLLRDPVDPWGGKYRAYVQGFVRWTPQISVWVLSGGKNQSFETNVQEGMSPVSTVLEKDDTDIAVRMISR